MENHEYLDEVYNSISKSNTMTPFWSYTTLLNKINALNYEEKNHISHYSPDDKEAGLGRTASGLPIKHYTLGSGKKHILVLGAEHGNDIINSQAIYFLMNYLSKKISKENLNDFLKLYTFDFVPVLNPEGYIITTSAIDFFIRKYTDNKFDIEGIDFDKAIELFIKFTESYNKTKDEDLTPIHNSLYSYQELFSGIDETCISKDFQNVRHQVNALHRAYNMPFEMMCNFVSNGNGIDLLNNRKNSKLFSEIDKTNKLGECLYNNSNAFRNVPISFPSSKGCPTKAKNSSGNIEFELENENLALLNYYSDLKQENETLELLMSVQSKNKLLRAKKYIEYYESEANPCGAFTDSENILNTYLQFIDSFTTDVEDLVQKNTVVTVKKNH